MKNSKRFDASMNTELSQSDWMERYEIQNSAINAMFDDREDDARIAFESLSQWDRDHGLGDWNVPEALKF